MIKAIFLRRGPKKKERAFTPTVTVRRTGKKKPMDTVDFVSLQYS